MDRLSRSPWSSTISAASDWAASPPWMAPAPPQNNPVGFFINEATSQVLIGGFNLAESRKFRNLGANPNVAFVVDDLASVDPWTPRRHRDPRVGRRPHRRRPAGAGLQP